MGPISAGDCLLASLVCVLRWQLTLSPRSSGAAIQVLPTPVRPWADEGQRRPGRRERSHSR